MITSFAELNKAVAENMKLYVSSYKDISNILLNINKLNGSQVEKKENTGYNDIVSTVDLIRSLSE